MSAEFQMTFRTAEISLKRYSLRNLADTALKVSARFWFLVTVIGQLLFAFAIASFYGSTAARGDLEAWNRLMLRGHVDGRAAGNLAVYLHLVAGVIVILAGALQFVPQIRARFPAFHRWSGRLYMLSALTLSIAGLYMQWVNGSFGDETLRWGSALNAGLIWICAAMALRCAIGGDFRAHRRWALRLFLVVGGAWFFRVALFLSYLLFKGPVGFDPNTFSGPLLTFMAFAQFLIPLAPLELYFFVQSRPGASRRIAMAGLLFFLTIATGAGVFAISAAIWVPNIQAAFDSRESIAYTLSPVIASSGVEEAVRQYGELKAAAPDTYNFDETELNRLGYQLVRANRFREAIHIFQLNAEVYPRSANTWDSLAEAYLREGNLTLAIANYRKSLELNPNNRNALAALEKLGAR